eukprot:TRINITY_DN15328_c0_g1_i14.p2 TRINITY_DN15328_c0_g1~~TRINITY_DN15328_c0_g1_i14.p2  ORF type:complete len:110 (-),score=10.16 TRINITY_DN15328_c0_g1_i14:371-700(-)
MGSVFAKLKTLLFGRKLEVAVVGLENAGKTTFVNQLAHGETTTTLPTLGVNTKLVKIKSKERVKNRFELEDTGLGWTELFARRVAFVHKDLCRSDIHGRRQQGPNTYNY